MSSSIWIQRRRRGKAELEEIEDADEASNCEVPDALPEA
jgi:hypothetical protein